MTPVLLAVRPSTTDDRAVYVEVGVTWADLETIQARIGKTLGEAR